MNRIVLALATTCIALVAVGERVASAEIFSTSASKETVLEIESENLLYASNNFSFRQPDGGVLYTEKLPNANLLLAQLKEPEKPSTYIKKRRPLRRNRSARGQQETTAINLEERELRQAHNLVISSDSGTQLNARVSVDGRAVRTIGGRGGTVNLSNRLSKGRHTVEISGSYRPASSSVQVEFSGSSTTVTQTTEGSGTLRQTLIIVVH